MFVRSIPSPLIDVGVPRICVAVCGVHAVLCHKLRGILGNMRHTRALCVVRQAWLLIHLPLCNCGHYFLCMRKTIESEKDGVREGWVVFLDGWVPCGLDSRWKYICCIKNYGSSLFSFERFDCDQLNKFNSLYLCFNWNLAAYFRSRTLFLWFRTFVVRVVRSSHIKRRIMMLNCHKESKLKTAILSIVTNN